MYVNVTILDMIREADKACAANGYEAMAMVPNIAWNRVYVKAMRNSDSRCVLVEIGPYGHTIKALSEGVEAAREFDKLKAWLA